MASGCAAPVLANALTFITMSLGSICTLLPTHVIDYLSNKKDHQSTDDAIANTLCKLLGALLVAYSSAFILHSIKARLVSQAILGLSILLIGLLDSDSIEIYTIIFVGIGSVVVLIACIGLMCIFYPMSSSIEEQEEDSRPENTVPLLEDLTDAADRTDEVEEGIHPDESRITGTKRLLKLAGPHTFYLYVGCIVLLIRLPFSLSIPHFVSETLGALARTDYGEAKTSIFLLFALGTVDAALDFWCVFLFGKCNLNITRGVRIDTFAAILKQEIGFHDMTGSGDLASRLNSDAGEQQIYVWL
jgi:ABC-type multidrug transport system fused ATPase/permease subunit